MVHPKWLSLDTEDPKFQIPLLPALVAVALLGIGLALIHPALGLIGAVAFAYWMEWRYFSYLQCDVCWSFYFGGQLTANPNSKRPWTRTELKNLAYKVAITCGVLLVLFLPFYYMEQITKHNCAAICDQPGMISKVFFNKCTCVANSK